MAGKVGAELAESMLDAAGSLHQLQEELDRISLRYCSPGGSAVPTRSRKKQHKKKRSNVSMTVSGSKDDVARVQDDHCAQDTISLESSGSCEQASSLSSSSRFDSAIGSLHSHTDDSFSSQLSFPPSLQRCPKQLQLRDELHAPYYSPSLLTHRTIAAELPGNVVTVEQYFSPQPAMPTLVTAAEHEPTKEGAASVCEVQSGAGDRITVMGTQVQLRQKTHREKPHDQETAGTNRRHFKWLELSFESTDNENPDPDTCSGARGYGGGVELESEGSSSTVVAEETGGYTPMTDNDYSAESFSFTPIQREDHTLQVDPPLHGGSHLPSTHVSMPQDHSRALLEEETERRQQQRQPPQRSASILQRLRRRRGSFLRERRPRRQMPVQRSLSDRFVYHLKKRWEDQDQEEMNVISVPSHPRPIGRLLRTYAGRLHIIQLHRPADGRYGIYITQGTDQKIFISRFATHTAEKFYAGLLRPGDEIVSVNKQKIRGNSLDSVYALLCELDSVIIAVVPVTAHRNW